MKEQMKKLPGFWPLSLDMPPKSSWYFTKPIPLSLGLCHLLSLDVSAHSNNSERIHSKKKKSSKKIIIILLNLCSIVHSSFSPNSDFSDSSPSDSKSIASITPHQPLQGHCHPLFHLPSPHHLWHQGFHQTRHPDTELVVALHFEVHLGLLRSPNYHHWLWPQLFRRPQGVRALAWLDLFPF